MLVPDNMKRDLLDILACPACKAHPLELTVEKEEGMEIVQGKLRCPKCGRTYPIEKERELLLAISQTSDPAGAFGSRIA